MALLSEEFDLMLASLLLVVDRRRLRRDLNLESAKILHDLLRPECRGRYLHVIDIMVQEIYKESMQIRDELGRHGWSFRGEYDPYACRWLLAHSR